MNYNLDEMIKLWFAEDIGDGDHTTLSSIPADAMGKQQLIIKEDGILAGVEVAKRILNIFDPNLKMTQFLKDGDAVKKGDITYLENGYFGMSANLKIGDALEKLGEILYE